MAQVAVRAAEPEDVEAIAAIMSCPGVIHGTLQIPYRSVHWRRERLASQAGDTHSLVAEMDGHVVGSLGLTVESRPRRRHVGYIGMSVHDDFQGQGVGTALMAAAVDLAESWIGLTRLELTVYSDNAPAIHLYRKFGFEVEGTAREYVLRDGIYVDALYMARLARRT